MKKKTKVFAWRDLPMSAPLNLTLLWWLLLDRFDAAGWVWGTVFTVAGVIWIVFLIHAFTVERVSLLNKDE